MSSFLYVKYIISYSFIIIAVDGYLVFKLYIGYNSPMDLKLYKVLWGYQTEEKNDLKIIK